MGAAPHVSPGWTFTAATDARRASGMRAASSSSSSRARLVAPRATWSGGVARGEGTPLGNVYRDSRGRVVRFCDARELRAVSALQAEAFYDPVLGRAAGVTPLDAPLRAYFELDVLGTLRKKYEYAAIGRFAPLVMESEDEKLIGVIELSVQRDFEVMRALEDVRGLTRDDEYAYLSCMCVDENFRGQRIAASLIRAAESVAAEWKFNLTTLHVYEENDAARRAYERCGYKVLDRPFRTPYDVVKNQRKLLMAKRIG